LNRFTCACGRTYEIRQVGEFAEVTTRRQRIARRKAQRTAYSRYNLEAEGLVDHPYAPDLEPGQTLKLETPMQGPTYEANVGVPFGEAVLYGTGAALVSIVFPLLAPATFRWYTPFVVLPIATGIAIFVTPERARKLLLRVEEWTGVDINQDGKVGQKTDPIPIEHRRPDKDGKVHNQYGEIPGVEAGEHKLAEWFYLICRSKGEGFSYRAAKNYGITQSEANAIQVWFLTQKPPLATRARNNWIRPNDEGFDTMWGVVTRHFPDAHLPQERA
jgi:hypothetical protein